MKIRRKRINDVKKLNIVVGRSVSNFKPPEQLTVSEWADKYRRLSAENSAEPGKWKTSRTPYLKEIMDTFVDPNIHRIAVVASSQVGKTEMEMNMLGYVIDNDPGPMMFIMPNMKPNAEEFSKRRLAPMIRDTPHLRSKVSDVKAKDGNNTIFTKSYPGGLLTITGSNSPANLAATPCRYVFGDERDRWTKSAGTEGDPWGLVEARTNTFYNSKMVEVSTPTIKGASAIEKSFLLGTQEYWCVECPHCHEYGFPKWDNIRFKPSAVRVGGTKQWTVEEIYYACPVCGCASTEQEIRKAPKKWVANNPEAYKKGFRSFWINGFCSPWMSWEHIILKYLDSQDDPEKRKTVYNTLLGELWEDRSSDDCDEEELMARREEYEADLPDGVLCLTCGVDTQNNRLEYEVVGYGFGEENWGIERGFLMGDPAEEEVWLKLDAIIDKVYRFKNGKGLKISVTFVDSGGGRTQNVYEQCAKRINKRVFAIKGKGGEGIPFTKPPKTTDIIKEGQSIGKVWLYIIGVDSGKDHIMTGLKVKTNERGKRYSHFPLNEEKKYDELYFNGLLSEKVVYSGGKWKWDKISGHERNEPLDCRNYANAAFWVLRPNLDRLYQQINDIVVEKNTVVVKKKKQQKRKLLDEEW